MHDDLTDLLYAIDGMINFADSSFLIHLFPNELVSKKSLGIHDDELVHDFAKRLGKWMVR